MNKRVLAFLPAVAFLATFGVFFVHKNREARTIFSSGRGLLALAIIVGGYLLLAWAVRRLTGGHWMAPVALTIVVLGLAAWLVRPYYVDTVANRQLIAGPVATTAAPMSPPLTAAPTSTAAGSSPAPSPSGAAPATTATPQAVRLSTGTLRGINHDASGSASLVRAPNGTVVIRFETFAIEGSPDPQLYLVPSPDATSPGGIALGRMEGNVGELLDVAVPGGEGAGPGWTVLVWCGAFGVPIAHASQA